MERTQSNAELTAIQYMPLPDGTADVWLRKNIEAVTGEEGETYYEADEVYLRTELSLEEVQDKFDDVFESPEGYAIKAETEDEPASDLEALTARVAALETNMATLATEYISVKSAISADAVIEAAPI